MIYIKLKLRLPALSKVGFPVKFGIDRAYKMGSFAKIVGRSQSST